MRAALVAVLLFLVAGDAYAATVRVADPAGDATPSFNASTDLTALSVVWDGGALTVTATFAERPRTLTLDAVVSEASRDDSDPSVEECDQRPGDVLQLVGTNDGGSLGVKGVRGRIEVPSSWDGATVTYVFRHPTLDRELASRDPFTCASGNAGEDTWYGVFEGKVAKLTSATASRAVAAEAERRYGGTDPTVRCPRSHIVAEGQPTEDDREAIASAFCAFRVTGPARYRMGYAGVYLDHGVPRVSGISSTAYPNALKFCGMTDFSGGFRQPPVLGAYLAAWGSGCRAAPHGASPGAGAAGRA